jgi:hypothetical protein
MNSQSGRETYSCKERKHTIEQCITHAHFTLVTLIQMNKVFDVDMATWTLSTQV